MIICAAFVITNSFYDSAWAANLSLTSVLTNDPEEKTLVFSNRLKYFTAGRMSLSFIGVPLIAFFAQYFGNILSYTVTNFLLVVAFVATYWIQANLCKDYDPPIKNKEDAPPSESVSLKGMWFALIKNPPLILLMISDVCRQTATFVVGAMAFYYFSYVVKRPELFGTYLLLYPFAGLIGSLSSNYVYKFTKKLKNQWMMGLGGWATFLILAFFLSDNPYAFLVCIVLSQIMFGMGCAFDKALYADTIVYSEWKTGNPSRSFIMGLSALPVKIATTLKGLVTSAGLIFIGYVANVEQTAETVTGLKVLIMIVPAVFLIAGVLAFAAYPLTEDRIAKMLDDIKKEIKSDKKERVKK